MIKGIKIIFKVIKRLFIQGGSMKMPNVDARYYNLCLFIMWAIIVATSMIAICTESIILLYVMAVIFIVLIMLFIGKKEMMRRLKWKSTGNGFIFYPIDYQLAGFLVIILVLVSVALYDDCVIGGKKYIYDYAMACPAYLLIYLMIDFDD